MTPKPSPPRPPLRAVLAVLTSRVGLDDVVLGVALLLIAAGFWSAWKPGAFIVPGVVLLWLVLPSRSPFVTRPPVPKKPAAPDASAPGGPRR